MKVAFNCLYVREMQSVVSSMAQCLNYSQASAPDLSSIVDSGKQLKVDLASHPSEVDKLSAQLTGRETKFSLHNYIVNCVKKALALWGSV